jgi:hypothetical protein
MKRILVSFAGLLALAGCASADKVQASEEPNARFTCWGVYGYSGVVTNDTAQAVYFETTWSPTFTSPIEDVMAIPERTWHFAVEAGTTVTLNDGLTPEETGRMIALGANVATCNDSALWSFDKADFGSDIDWQAGTAEAVAKVFDD